MEGARCGALVVACYTDADVAWRHPRKMYCCARNERTSPGEGGLGINGKKAVARLRISTSSRSRPVLPPQMCQLLAHPHAATPPG
jgi:hypothetical protein